MALGRAMTLIIEILHMVLAGALSLIGIGYERAPECDPVQVQPAAYYELSSRDGEIFQVWLDASGPAAAVRPAGDCGRAGGSVTLPRMRLRA